MNEKRIKWPVIVRATKENLDRFYIENGIQPGQSSQCWAVIDHAKDIFFLCESIALIEFRYNSRVNKVKEIMTENRQNPETLGMAH